MFGELQWPPNLRRYSTVQIKLLEDQIFGKVFIGAHASSDELSQAEDFITS